MNEEEVKTLALFEDALKNGITVLKATTRGQSPKKREIYAHYDMSFINYRHIDGKTKSCGMLTCNTTKRGTKMPSLLTCNMYSVTSTKFKTDKKGEYGMVTLKFKLPKAEVSMICHSEQEYKFLSTGFKLVHRTYGTSSGRGSRDDRNYHARSVEEQYRVVGYQPLTYQYLKDGEIQHVYIGCGYSSEDLALFVLLLFALWSFILGYFGMLLKAALDTDDYSTALWYFFYFFIVLVGFVGLAVATTTAPEIKEDDIEAAAPANKVAGQKNQTLSL